MSAKQQDHFTIQSVFTVFRGFIWKGFSFHNDYNDGLVKYKGHSYFCML